MAYLAAPNAKGTTVPFSGSVVLGPWQNPLPAYPNPAATSGTAGTTSHGFVA